MWYKTLHNLEKNKISRENVYAYQSDHLSTRFINGIFEQNNFDGVF